ncbi:galactoside 2-alpha-L-fucosyltransferase SEC1-like [Mercenaria mercenaria]|uniref:galactoside 2-alpha-L-fucosyltransferase SEC1-like n=1 Tax=Mercenaria mercenaria TaxID=6596 RepID=UPI00234F7101|nr:galactoside 2-alpha-L-fucosyltransferase SEC1-like [Mercenaria mercenaria]
MSLKEAVNRNYFVILISILISFVLYITFTQTWNKDAVKYYDTNRRHEQLNIHKCFKTLWDRKAFSDFIRNNTTENGGNISTYRESSCNHFIKLASPGGRTGNQLFQIAALFGISFEYDFIPIIEPSFPLSKYFDLPNVSKVKLSNSSICTSQFPGIFYKCFNRSENDKAFNMTLNGYFQSWKYFKNSADIIRTVLKIRPRYMQNAKLFLQFHKKDGFKNICIHVRRTDMADKSLARKGYAAAPISFIYKAIQFCEVNFKKAIFFVLSDDIKWCRKNIKRNVIFSSFTDPGNDLALMTSCDHVVVTAGSFGWWGAWLSNGTAVYFNGYPRPGTKAEAEYIREDYYPPDWIGLS